MRKSAVLASFLILAPDAFGQACSTKRMSVSSYGVEGKEASSQPSITPDGRWVLFASASSSFVPGDNNGVGDIFLRDVLHGTLERVNVGPGGVECDAASTYPVMSDDARYVAFNTAATNLVPNDANATLDVFVVDRVTGVVERISESAGGTSGDGPSFAPVMAGGGRFVLFASWATNLVPNDTNATRDLFLRDRALGTIERVNVSTAGIEGDDMGGSNSLNAFISPDGRYVFFGSSATNLVAGDTNGSMDAFVRDRWNGTTSLLVQAPGGGAPNGFTDLGGATGDGRLVGFTSSAEDLVPGDTNGGSDAFVLDRSNGAIERVNLTPFGVQSSEGASAPIFSVDGRFAVFSSNAADLVLSDSNGKRDFFRRNRLTGTTELLVLVGGTTQLQLDLFGVSLTAAGDQCVFSYPGNELAIDDQNGTSDVFLDGCTSGTLFCFGDGSGSACPCGAGAARAGCPNSVGGGALLEGVGHPSTNLDTLALVVRGLPTSTPVIFLLGSAQQNGGMGSVFGDGLRCVGGTVTRLAMRHSVQGASSWGYGVPGAPLLSHQCSVWAAGEVRYYQAWYRNAVSYCTPSTFNLTNGFEVVWLL